MEQTKTPAAVPKNPIGRKGKKPADPAAAPVKQPAASTQEKPKTVSKKPSKDLSIIPAARMGSLLDAKGVNKNVRDEFMKEYALIRTYKENKKILENGSEWVTTMVLVQKKDGKNRSTPTRNKVELSAERKAELTKFIAEFEKDEAKMKALAVTEDKLRAIRGAKVRISAEAKTALAIIMDALVSQLAGSAISVAQSERDTTVTLDHLLRQELRVVSLYPLIDGLKIFKEKLETLENERASINLAKKISEERAKWEEEFRKVYKISTKVSLLDFSDTRPKDKKAAKPKSVKPPEGAVKVKQPSEMHFKTFISKILTATANKANAVNFKFSSELVKFINTLIFEVTARVSNRIVVHVQSTRVKTINLDVLMKLLEPLLADGCEQIQVLQLFEDDDKKAPKKNESLPADKQLPLRRYYARNVITFKGSSFDSLFADIKEKVKITAADVVKTT